MTFAEIAEAIQNTTNTSPMKIFIAFKEGEHIVRTDPEGNKVYLCKYKDKLFFKDWEPKGLSAYNKYLKEKPSSTVH